MHLEDCIAQYLFFKIQHYFRFRKLFPKKIDHVTMHKQLCLTTCCHLYGKIQPWYSQSAFEIFDDLEQKERQTTIYWGQPFTIHSFSAPPCRIDDSCFESGLFDSGDKPKKDGFVAETKFRCNHESVPSVLSEIALFANHLLSDKKFDLQTRPISGEFVNVSNALDESYFSFCYCLPPMMGYIFVIIVFDSRHRVFLQVPNP